MRKEAGNFNFHILTYPCCQFVSHLHVCLSPLGEHRMPQLGGQAQPLGLRLVFCCHGPPAAAAARLAATGPHVAGQAVTCRWPMLDAVAAATTANSRGTATANSRGTGTGAATWPNLGAHVSAIIYNSKPANPTHTLMPTGHCHLGIRALPPQISSAASR
jgi:hypothetical protein